MSALLAGALGSLWGFTVGAYLFSPKRITRTLRKLAIGEVLDALDELLREENRSALEAKLPRRWRSEVS